MEIPSWTDVPLSIVPTAALVEADELPLNDEDLFPHVTVRGGRWFVTGNVDKFRRAVSIGMEQVTVRVVVLSAKPPQITPCVALQGWVHIDSPCRCFQGGPSPSRTHHF